MLLFLCAQAVLLSFLVCLVLLEYYSLHQRQQSKVKGILGLFFSVLGVAFLIAQAIFTALASAKKKSYYELISNGIKVNGIVEKVYMQKFLQYGKKSPYRVLYSYTYGGKIYHHKSHLLWDKPYMKETDSIAVYINDSEKSAIQLQGVFQLYPQFIALNFN